MSLFPECEHQLLRIGQAVADHDVEAATGLERELWRWALERIGSGALLAPDATRIALLALSSSEIRFGHRGQQNNSTGAAPIRG